MKWESADLRVGAAVLAAIALLAAAALWLGGAAGDRRGLLYATFPRVDGVAAQAPVQVAGFTVGRVESVEPVRAADGSLRFRVAMRVEWRLPSGAPLPLSSGTRARLLPPPVAVAGNLLAGTIALEPGPAGARALAPGDSVPGESDAPALDEARTLALALGGDVHTTLASLRDVADSLARAAREVRESSAAVQRSASATGRAVPELSASVRREMAAADSLVRDARRLTAALGAVAPNVAVSLDSARAAFGATHRLADDAGGALAARDAELARVLARLDTTSALLNRFVREVSRNPVRALTGVRDARLPAARPAPLAVTPPAGAAAAADSAASRP